MTIFTHRTFFEKISYYTILLVLLASTVQTSAQQLAFPTAEGYGKYTTGGRGTTGTPTTVFLVTSLADDGTAGTLRYAVNQSTTTYPFRTIIFRVSGTIHLTSALKFPKNTTVAGQTAPGDGICLADWPVQVNGNNVIVRYMRFRMGDKNQNLGMVNGSGDSDAFDDAGVAASGHKDIIIDHCTMSWSDDEACTFYAGDSLTLQWNIISEPLNYSYHFETGDADFEHHGYGGIWGGRNASFHHNLLAHIQGRVPRFDGSRNLPNSSSPVVGTENADFRNNIIYNWGSYNVNGGEGGNYNIINNYYKYGPSTSTSTSSGVTIKYETLNPYKQTSPVLPYGQYYMMGNYIDGSTSTTNDNWKGAAMNSGSYSDTTSAKVTTAFAFMAVNTQLATDCYASVLNGAGVILPNRDTLDQRIVKDVANRTGAIIDVQGGYPHGTAYALTVNAWPTLNSLTAATDADLDGMPDVWETRRGLNPASAADRNGYNANGYTNLENYLNGDSIIAVGTTNTCVTARTVTANSGGGFLDIKDTTFSYILATDTMNVFASIKNDGSYGAFTSSYYVTGTTRTFNSKPYLNRNVTIVPANTITSAVTVRLYFTTAEYNILKTADATILTPANLKVYITTDNSCVSSFSNSGTTIITPTSYGLWGTYQTGYYIEFTTTKFGTFFIAGSSFVTPLTILSINGSLQNNQVKISWSTSNEVNTKNFSIERSSDGNNFSAIGSVDAKGLAANDYSFIDANPILNATSYYRLKMMDKDGSYRYSSIVIINAKTKNGLTVYPNPAVGQTTVLHSKAVAGSNIEVIAADGRRVASYKVTAGTEQTYLNISTLKAGSYLVVFTNGEERSVVKLLKY